MPNLAQAREQSRPHAGHQRHGEGEAFYTDHGTGPRRHGRGVAGLGWRAGAGGRPQTAAARVARRCLRPDYWRHRDLHYRYFKKSNRSTTTRRACRPSHSQAARPYPGPVTLEGVHRWHDNWFSNAGRGWEIIHLQSQRRASCAGRHHRQRTLARTNLWAQQRRAGDCSGRG